jgi:hypothetical protein
MQDGLNRILPDPTMSFFTSKLRFFAARGALRDPDCATVEFAVSTVAGSCCALR